MQQPHSYHPDSAITEVKYTGDKNMKDVPFHTLRLPVPGSTPARRAFRPARETRTFRPAGLMDT